MLAYHFDYRGSTVALTDGNGNVTDRMEYSAYGTTTYRTGTNDTPFLYGGRYGVMTDPNRLLYMRARYYNPYLCRFINADPAGFAGGLNFYAFADGNPVSYLDPFGLGAAGESQGGWWSTGWTYTPSANILGLIPAPQGYTPYVWGDTFGKNLYAQGYNIVSAIDNAAYGLLDILGFGQEKALNAVGLTSQDLLAIPMFAPEVQLLNETRLLAAESATQLELGFVKNLENPNFVLYKASQFNPSMLRPGEYTLNLPWLRNEALDWAQNQQALQRAMNIGNPIREANPNALGGWLQRERDFLSSQGWQRTQQGSDVFWVKPSGQ